MKHSNKLLAPLVSAAVALIAVTNYCIIRLLGHPNSSTPELLEAIWPMAIPTSAAVICVMSLLYHSLQEVMVELNRRQNQLRASWQRDSLTGLASRQLFEEQLHHALACYRRSGEKFAVIILDLDHFKRVNDLHGHQVGDELLKLASSRLVKATRECDIVARFGGDEFLVLQKGLKTQADVRRLCNRLCRDLQQPYEIDSLQLRPSASIGAVVATEAIETATDYVRAADVALYDAKESGRNCFRFFRAELDERLRRRDVLEADLRKALREEDGITVYFQPQISANGTLIAVEALFRWQHAFYGEIPASEAVQLAEESDLIDALGEFVFRKAATVARKHKNLSICINLSPAQFARCENLPEKLHTMAIAEQLETSQIEFEVTEQLFMEVGNGCDSQMERLRALGFRLALDDFGTGYSSLSYLRRFHVDRLKLDKSFASSGKIDEDIVIMRAAVALAHLLDLEVVAEGIESECQESAALESGCDALQGHRYGLPMSATEFEDYVSHHMAAAA